MEKNRATARRSDQSQPRRLSAVVLQSLGLDIIGAAKPVEFGETEKAAGEFECKNYMKCAMSRFGSRENSSGFALIDRFFLTDSLILLKRLVLRKRCSYTTPGVYGERLLS